MILTYLRGIIDSERDYAMTVQYLASLVQLDVEQPNVVLMGNHVYGLTELLRHFDTVKHLKRAEDVRNYDMWGCCLLTESMSLLTHIERTENLHPVLVSINEKGLAEFNTWLAGADVHGYIKDIFGNLPL